MNNQFQSVFTTEDLSNTPQLDYPVHPPIQDLSFTTHDIQLLLETLDPVKAPGPDHIPTKVIKLCANAITPVLQIIHSQSLEHATLPQEWLLANITLVFKKGNRSALANYRPFSLTSVLCKVMEHIIFHHIMSYFTSQSLLIPLQHGFRPNHSCQTQPIDFIDEIQRSTNARQQIDLVFTDFSKAFDTVPHRRLLNKLKFYSVRGPLLQWISSWLTKRQQRVIVDSEASNATPVKSGVPQGTVLGPLMFLVYINYINENITSSVKLFADDCVIYNTTRCRTTTVQEDLQKLSEWTKLW